MVISGEIFNTLCDSFKLSVTLRNFLRTCHRDPQRGSEIHRDYRRNLLIPFFSKVTLKFISNPVLILENFR